VPTGLDAVLKRVHPAALIAFAGLLGLSEGPAQIACAFVLVTTALAGGYRSFRPGLVELGIILWVIAGIPGVVLAARQSVHLGSEATLRPLHALAFLVGGVAITRADDRLLDRVALAFIACLTINAAYGYLQVAIGELPLDHLLLKNPKSQQVFIPGHEFAMRSASGLYYNRLKLAHMGMVALGLVGLILFTKRPIDERMRRLAALALMIIAGAMVLTYARMALVACISAALILALILRRSRMFVIVAAVPLLLLAVVAMTETGLSHLRESLHDAEIRAHMFGTAIDLFRQHPIAGIGHGLYRATVAPTWDGKGALMDAHNAELQVLAETGLIGFVGLATAFVVCLGRVWRRVRRDRMLTSSAAVRDRTALFGLCAFFVLGLLHVPTHHAPVAMLLWCLAGIAAHGGDVENREQT
jgi:hypothetical protein